jgi:signal transduction histidine kinase
MTPAEIAAIKEIPLFSTLDDAVITAVAEVGRSRKVTVGESIFRAGDFGDELYIVLAGAVRTFIVEQDHDVELAVYRPGNYFGELTVIDGRPRSGNATVLESGLLFIVKRAHFIELLSQFAPLLDDILQKLAGNLRESNSTRVGLALQNKGMKEEAELDRLRSLSQMVAGVAHEINTPIGIVQNAASLVSEMLTKDAIPSLAKDEDAADTLRDLSEACDLIQKNIAVAAKLVQSFKSLSVRQQHEARERVDILAHVQESLDLYRLKARRSHLQLVAHSDLIASERQWEGFPGQLTQIVLNLVTNADRYAYPGDREGTVEVAISGVDLPRDTPGFEIRFRDHGEGIAPDDLTQIFNPFFTTGRASGGTGLGLAIVHNLATASLRGSIRVESTVGKGTTFILRIPRTLPEGRS